MFTGIIESLGTVVQPCGAGGGRLRVAPETRWDDLAIGESIACDGACLSVTGFDGTAITFDAVEETAGRTTLGRRRAGDSINLERALRLGDRMGGHYVLGHVDCTGAIRSVRKKRTEIDIVVSHPAAFSPFVLPKGSIAVNGISLTLGAEREKECFHVHIVPVTVQKTNLAALREGEAVNLEFDYFGKWVLSLAGRTDGHMQQLLAEAGFFSEELWNI